MTSSDFSDYSDYNYYDDYRDSDLDVDLDSERFSELVAQLTIIDKLQKLNHDIGGLVIYNQIVTWTAFAILAMFLFM